MELQILRDTDLIQHFIINAPHMMWFLGAGTSRTAGMPTATDFIWELKRNYYCLQENQDIRKHDINNDAIKKKIQSYMDSKGFPAAWSAEEYSFYFDLTFGSDYAAQQQFLHNQLAPEKISLNIGHRALAGLIALKQARLIFTTNFDEVIESAYAQVSGTALPTYHLEGSYAALEALNQERFPIYAKVHGDFRYQSIKNLEKDLQQNDEQIRKCFTTASNFYGLIVAGYSGRDANVMKMFHDALSQTNPFPHGLFWAVPQARNILPSVIDFIKTAQDKGINAHLVEVGTFDILLSRIWKQAPERNDDLDKKVRTALSSPVSIPLPKSGGEYPIVRTNGMSIVDCPTVCAHVDLKESIRYGDIKKALTETKAQAIVTNTDRVLAWGDTDQIQKIFSSENILKISQHEIPNPVNEISKSTFMKAFYEEALARALRHGKPLLLRQHYRRYFLVVDHKHKDDQIFDPLKQSLDFKGKPGFITGRVKNNATATWAESVGIKLEERHGSLVLLLKPDIWITPQTERQNCDDFLRDRRRYRYNPKQHALLDAWIKILFGVTGAHDVKVSCLPETEYPVEFTINTRSVFSLREARNAS